jgi:hypothetical protein
MGTLAEYQSLVERMEQRVYTVGAQDRDTAIRSLMREICEAPWQREQDRAQAQSLVFRLESVRRRGRGPNAGGKLASDAESG